MPEMKHERSQTPSKTSLAPAPTSATSSAENRGIKRSLKTANYKEGRGIVRPPDGGATSPLQLKPAKGSDKFNDVAAGAYYDEALGRQSSGADAVFQGDPDGNFRPGDPLNQAECLKILSVALGLVSGEVRTEPWYKPYLTATKKVHVASGDPAHQMTRSQVIYQIVGLSGLSPVDAHVQPFYDVDRSHSYFTSIMSGARAGYMTGDPGGHSMRPDDALNRAEIVTITDRVTSGNTPWDGPIFTREEAAEVLRNAMYDLTALLSSEGGISSDIAAGWTGAGFDVYSRDGFDKLLEQIDRNWNDLAGFRAAVTSSLKAKYDSGELAQELTTNTKDLKKAKKSGYYESTLHHLYGKIVAYLTGGEVSESEAMGSNPTGGIAGAGASEVVASTPVSGMDATYKPASTETSWRAENLETMRAAVTRHAVVHDALGFLRTQLGIGPGYGTSPESPVSGQTDGVLYQALYGLDKEYGRLVEEVLAESEPAVATTDGMADRGVIPGSPYGTGGWMQ